MHRSIEKKGGSLVREDSSLSLLLIMRRYVNVIHQNFSYSVPHMVQLGKEEEFKMILEAVMLQVKDGMETEYESVFKQASSIISSMQGYINHELQRCMERKGKYLLLVQWETLEDHTIGFRQSEQYQEWKALLHHFYDPVPTVEHFERVELSRN